MKEKYNEEEEEEWEEDNHDCDDVSLCPQCTLGLNGICSAHWRALLYEEGGSESE